MTTRVIFDAERQGALPVRVSLWTVYARPRDYPNDYVVRRFEIGGGNPEPVATNDMFTAPSLAALRALLPPGLTRLTRLPGDDPSIVEVWL